MVDGAEKALEFYKKAFGAQVGGVHKTPEGKVMHAEFKIGDSRLFLADEFPGMGASPKTLGGSPGGAEPLHGRYRQRIQPGGQCWSDGDHAAGEPVLGRSLRPDQRPFGHIWALGQHIEDVSPEEMERRAREAFAHMAAKA